MVLRQLVARSTTKLGHTTLTVYRNQSFNHQGVQVKSSSQFVETENYCNSVFFQCNHT